VYRDLGVSTEHIEARFPLASNTVCSTGGHQQVVNMVVQQMPLEVLRSPETTQAVQILHMPAHSSS